MAVTLYPSDRVELIELRAGEVVWSVPSPRYSNTIDISPDGRIVAVGGEFLSLIDADNPLRSSTYRDFANNIHTVRFSPSGDAVAVSSYDGHIRIISTDMKTPDATLIKVLRHAGDSSVYSLVFGRDGSFLISSSGDRTIRFWGK
jgi:WD40 repeat protein